MTIERTHTDYARNWIIEADGDVLNQALQFDDDIEDVGEDLIIRIVDRHYPGGWSAFLATFRPDFEYDTRRLASEWHGGQSSALYMLASTGTVSDHLQAELDHIARLSDEGQADAERIAEGVNAHLAPWREPAGAIIDGIER